MTCGGLWSRIGIIFQIARKQMFFINAKLYYILVKFISDAYNKLIEGQLGNIVYLFLVIKVEVEVLLQLRLYFFRHRILFLILLSWWTRLIYFFFCSPVNAWRFKFRFFVFKFSDIILKIEGQERLSITLLKTMCYCIFRLH